MHLEGRVDVPGDQVEGFVGGVVGGVARYGLLFLIWGECLVGINFLIKVSFITLSGLNSTLMEGTPAQKVKGTWSEPELRRSILE